MADKVTPFPERVDKPPLALVEEDYRACRHHRFKLDKSLPLVTCADCKAVMDPYAVLRRMARSFADRDYRLAELKRATAEYEKQVERQMTLRKKKALAEADARELARLRATIAADPDKFAGFIAEGEVAGED